MKVTASDTSEISAWLANLKETGLRPTRGPVVFSHDLFLSYSRFQVVDAKRIHGRLLSTKTRAQPTRIFFAENARLPDDRTDILGRLGVDQHTDLRLQGRYLKWLTDIPTSSCHFVAIVTKAYMDSPWCRYELSAFHQIARESPARGMALLVDEGVSLLAERLVNDDPGSGVTLDQLADYELAVHEAMLKHKSEALSKHQADRAAELRAAAAKPLFERWLEHASRMLQPDADRFRATTPSPARESLNTLLERAEQEAKALLDAGWSPW